jgi:hypothetical protein
MARREGTFSPSFSCPWASRGPLPEADRLLKDRSLSRPPVVVVPVHRARS